MAQKWPKIAFFSGKRGFGGGGLDRGFRGQKRGWTVDSDPSDTPPLGGCLGGFNDTRYVGF